MKLLQLEMVNFLGHKRTSLDLSKGITVINGPNGGGKSSVRDAILYALTGRCRTTDGGGRNYGSLIKRGEESFTVHLHINMGEVPSEKTPGRNHVITRIGTKSGKSVQVNMDDGAELTGDKAESYISDCFGGAGKDFIEALVDMPHVFSLTPEKRMEVLRRVIPARMETEDFVARAKTGFSLSDEAAAALKEGLGVTTTITPAIAAAKYERIFEARRRAKVELSAIPDMPTETKGPLSEVSSEELRTRSSRLETEIQQLATEIRDVDQRRTEVAVAVKQIETINRKIDAVESSRADGPGDSIEEAKARLDRLENQETQHVEIHGQAIEDSQTARNGVIRIEHQLEMANLTKCPDGALYPGRECPIAAGKGAGDEKVLADLKKKLTTAKGTRTKKDNRVKETQAALDLHREAQARAHDTWTEAKERGSVDQGALESLQGQLPGLIDIVDGAQGRSYQEEYEQKTELLGRLELEHREVVGVLAVRDHMEASGNVDQQRETLRHKIGLLEELVPAMAPRGMQAILIMSAAEGFELGINLHLGSMMPGYGIKIDSAGLYVTKDGEGMMSIESLSPSEGWRLGLAIAGTMSAMSLQILIVDAADVLTADNRSLVSNVLSKLSAEGYIKSCLILSATDERPKKTLDSTVARYWVEGGRVEAV